MMEEKMDHTAENELPLFNDEPVENIVPETVPAEPVTEEEEIVPQESVPAADPVIAEPDDPVESAPVESASAPAVPAASVPAGGKCKVPAGLRPTPAFGNFLRQLREANGLSLDDLARTTRIKRGYLEAVEQESYKDLPAVAYTLAYINTLADYYGVDAGGKEILTSEVRKHLEYEAPEENKAIIGREVSEENQILLRRILFAGSGLIVLLAVLITLAVLFFSSGSHAACEEEPGVVQGGAPAGLDEAHLVELQPAPVLQKHVLPVPKR